MMPFESFDEFLAWQRKFLEANGESIEMLLQNGVFFLPGGLSGDGVQEQLLCSLSELFSVYRTLVCAPQVPGIQAVTRPQVGASNVCSSISKEQKYTVVLFLIRGIRCLQLVYEMRYPSPKGCAILEFLKILLKAGIAHFLYNRGRKGRIREVGDTSVLAPRFFVEESVWVEDANATVAERVKDRETDQRKRDIDLEFIGKRSGVRLRGRLHNIDVPPVAAAVTGPIGFELPQKKHGIVLTQAQRLVLSQRRKRQLVFLDLLYQLRPLFVLYLQAKKKPWLAWWTALLIDLGTSSVMEMLLVREKAEAWTPPGNDPTFRHRIECMELRRRRQACFWALLRSPFFEKYFPEEKVQRFWDSLPVLKHFNIVQLLLLWRRYYFYTSGT
ncbi:unnamed protein product [Amoebophrya sp. A25]|nr:unnamed protein product [Amoebophrya sp. A25]|eukprot:GSA25T00016776001.1